MSGEPHSYENRLADYVALFFSLIYTGWLVFDALQKEKFSIYVLLEALPDSLMLVFIFYYTISLNTEKLLQRSYSLKDVIGSFIMIFLVLLLSVPFPPHNALEALIFIGLTATQIASIITAVLSWIDRLYMSLQVKAMLWRLQSTQQDIQVDKKDTGFSLKLGDIILEVFELKSGARDSYVNITIRSEGDIVYRHVFDFDVEGWQEAVKTLENIEKLASQAVKIARQHVAKNKN
ncbi:MAG: hypothetical protein JHC26_01305 [Thermofilum sp.]|uniref:hypothetical protein n=1 Tax=Thermofilum sp. TaxID=1961369 RepID=UPI0025856031|nr:hypothetical protein [Thermofilum sp.]MCI4407697.1 hypothetical protein [Thermofilum sp.]